MSEEKKAPGFLKTISILTIIWSSIVILLSLLAIGAAPLDALFGIAMAALCLVGALMMMKLKKVGYYLYLVGELVPIIYSLIVNGGIQSTGISFLDGMIAIVYLVVIGIPIAFVAMYTVNLKHLS